MKRLLLLSLALVSCGAPKSKTSTEILADPPAEFKDVGGTASANDLSLFLAGKPVQRGAALSRLQRTANYQEFVSHMSPNWRYFARPRVNKQSAWSEQYLRPGVGAPRVLFYPFGGPDLLHAVALFPQASNYVLVGQEPAGHLPDLENADPLAVLGALPGFAKATETQLQAGYFITKDMKGDLNNGPLQGVAPVMMASLSLMNATIDSVQPISAAGRPGVDIRFRTSSGVDRRAIYISGDLSNSGFNSSFQTWIASLGNSVSYFKAASYLCHDNRFSNVRNFVLSQSRAVVQDDSGIPFRYFETDKWNIRFLGNYQRPIPLFAKHDQPDLRAAYQAIGGGPPIPFGSGYHYQAEEANLILATRR